MSSNNRMEKKPNDFRLLGGSRFLESAVNYYFKDIRDKKNMILVSGLLFLVSGIQMNSCPRLTTMLHELNGLWHYAYEKPLFQML